MQHQPACEPCARPIRVGIDLTALLPRPTGVDGYLLRLVDALADTDRETAYTLFVNREDREAFAGRLPASFRVVGLCLRPRPFRLVFQQALLPALRAALGLEVVHSPSFIMPLLRGGGRHLLTVYDLTSFSHPEHHAPLRRSWPYRRAIVASARRAHMITVPSQSTRRELLRFVPAVAPSRVRVVVPGIGAEFAPRGAAEVAEVRRRLGLARPYVLYLGSLDSRKNLVRLLEAYAGLVRDHHIVEDLVLAGPPGWGADRLLAVVRGHGIQGRVRLPGYVHQRDLPGLLSGARLFVYPSLAEGFGFPPLEAMACGVPTVAAATTSLTENLEGAAELVPPEDVPALAAAIHRALVDDDLRARLRRDGMARSARYSWRHAAEDTVRCYLELAKEIRSQKLSSAL